MIQAKTEQNGAYRENINEEESGREIQCQPIYHKIKIAKPILDQLSKIELKYSCALIVEAQAIRFTLQTLKHEPKS